MSCVGLVKNNLFHLKHLFKFKLIRNLVDTSSCRLSPVSQVYVLFFLSSFLSSYRFKLTACSGLSLQCFMRVLYTNSNLKSGEKLGFAQETWCYPKDNFLFANEHTQILHKKQRKFSYHRNVVVIMTWLCFLYSTCLSIFSSFQHFFPTDRLTVLITLYELYL